MPDLKKISPCVVKTNHGSGGCVFVFGEKTIHIDMHNVMSVEDYNMDNIRRRLRNDLNTNYAPIFLEMQYKNIRPQILVEKCIGIPNIQDPYSMVENHRFMCLNKGQYIWYEDGGANFDCYTACFDRNYQPLQIYNWPADAKPHRPPYARKKPEHFEEMFDLVKILSSELPFVRVDLLAAGGEVFFSEFTFTPTGGRRPFSPEMDLKLGQMANQL